MILITGATGTNGREIIKQISDKGVKIRVMVRKRENAGLPHSSNIEYVNGNFDDFCNPEWSAGRSGTGFSIISQFRRTSNSGRQLHTSGQASGSSPRGQVFDARHHPELN
jgi:nucleoside-diphosphate-sugar epimerase